VTEKIRVDKWLWTVRIFKSRTSATDACKAQKVKIDNAVVKPSALVTNGSRVELKRNGFIFSFLVKQVLKSRVSAVIAAEAYENTTPKEELDKYKTWFVSKAGTEYRDRGTGRPTKKERRELDEFKIYSFDDIYLDEEE
jgi:ribosome-associated heat shock protein Hsp15